MKQFEKMGWIRQGFLGVIICVVMSPSNAMTVRERYLQQNPQFAAHQAVEHRVVRNNSSSAKKQSRKHRIVEKKAAVRQKATSRHHAKVARPIVKHSRVQHAKRGHQRVIVPKHSKSKFDKQQARDAQAALKHRSVKRSVRVKQAPIAKHHFRKASAKHASHHVAKPVLKHHRKHHRAR